MPPDVSYAQTNFSSGEWSPNFRGRLDDKAYESALTQCLNYIPNQEQSLSPRSGFRRCGITKDGAPAKLLSFRFNYFEPYVSEFTANNLRFWANGLPIFKTVYATLSSVTGNPPTFIISSSLFGDTAVPTTWANGDSVMIQLASAATVAASGHLANREFIITIVSRSAGTITLTDAETGSPLTGTIGTIGNPRFYAILDLTTYFGFVDDLRQVAFTSQSLTASTNDAVSVVTGPEHKVSYLQAVTSPRSISHNLGLEAGLIREQFIDGPYLDSLGPNVPATVSGTTGSITVTLHGFSLLARYIVGDVVYRQADGLFYVSLVAPNINHALQTAAPFINSFWARLVDFGWNSGTSYDLGVMIYLNTDINGYTGTVYYSIQVPNLNKDPLTQPTYWSTTPPTWDIAATYPAYAVVISAGIRYVSVSVPVVGTAPAAAPTVWFPISSTFFETAHAVIDASTGFRHVGVLNTVTDAGDSPQNGIGRLIRLKAAPQPWSAAWSYTAGDYVNFKDNIYKALTSANLANIPDQTPTNWEIQTKTILWTWGQFTHITDNFTATVLIKGDDLPNTDPVWEWRLGLFSDSTSWPRCGAYHEGRLCFSGPLSNRIDMGRSNLGYDFAPTAPDGTVADNNAISYVLNSAEDERIHALKSTAEGVVALTSEKEWLISASNLNDPLTPTSIQAHPITGFGTTNVEAANLPSGLAFIQSGRRRLMEFRSFVDMTNYQSRLNALDLTRTCQHLTGDGIIEAQYQRLPQPVIWCLPGGLVLATTQPDICPVPGSFIHQTNVPAYLKLFGLAYSRTPDVSYIAPFSYEHGLDYLGNAATLTASIAVQRGWIDTAEYLYNALIIDDTALTYMEMLMPTFETSPFDDLLNTNGTVNKFGTLSSAYFLDSGITPAGCKFAIDGLSVTFYGLHTHAGKTVQFTCRGKYVGDYAIAADGSVSVTFNAAFAKTDIGRAMNTTPNATLLPASFQSFYLDKNGNTGVLEPAANTTGFFGQFGFKYRRRGKLLRPSVPGANGPAFAKIRRNERMGVYLERGQEVSIGDTFNTLFALSLEVPRTDGKVSSLTVGLTDFVTGIFRDEVNSDHTFDGELCWEQTRPVPGGILAVGGFEDVTDT